MKPDPSLSDKCTLFVYAFGIVFFIALVLGFLWMRG